MKRILLPVTLLVALVAACCVDEDTLTGISCLCGYEGAEPGPATLTATIDGHGFKASTKNISVGAYYPQPGQLAVDINASEGPSGRRIELRLGFVTGPGGYWLGVDGTKTRGGTGTVTFPPNRDPDSFPKTYVTPLDGVSGSVTITEYTEWDIKGTFHFTAEGTDPSYVPRTRSVTEGEFDISVSHGLPPVPTSSTAGR